ncbi:antitoxin VapB family protein [Candidatus Woesearchaeota archaeon]|nr:antitoxin VapB family protein [Candidatus Woesearchaeota archaeon]
MTRVISIADEAYEQLARLKQGRSFSQTILELTNEKARCGIMQFAGIWDKQEGLRIKKELQKERAQPSRRMQ